MAHHKDLTNRIERLEVFEERLGVRFNALYAYMDEGGYIRLNGEIHALQGTDLQRDIRIVIDVFDPNGRIIEQSSEGLSAENFFGFESFSLFVGEVPLQQIAKLRLYPKPY